LFFFYKIKKKQHKKKHRNKPLLCFYFIKTNPQNLGARATKFGTNLVQNSR